MSIRDVFIASVRLVNDIAEDMLKNGCSKEVLEHASQYAQLENEYGTFWRINKGGVYAYLDIDEQGKPTGEMWWNNADIGCGGMDYKETMKHLEKMTEQDLYDTEEGSYFSDLEITEKDFAYVKFKDREQKKGLDSQIQSATIRSAEKDADREDYTIVAFKEYIPGAHFVSYSDMGGMPSSSQTDIGAINVDIRLSVLKEDKEKAEALLEEAWDNAVLDSFENSPLDKDNGGKYTWEELDDMPVQEYILKYLDAKGFTYKDLKNSHVKNPLQTENDKHDLQR